jgi:hypothetical protein
MVYRYWLGSIGLFAAYCSVLPGLAYAKSSHTFLAGEGKPGVFYAWAFGLWFSLLLARHGQRIPKTVGILSFCAFGLLLMSVILEEFRLVFGT